ncbi:MAG TPA: DinB family protein [Pseudonocardia sp.]|nr:DinB family protein [Pseudonocardia sp.]
MTTSDTASAAASLTGSASGERADILETLRTHRFFLRHTVEGLTDEQARLSPTASKLTLGGLIKHVAATESSWVDFIERGTEAMAMPEGEFDPSSELAQEWANEFKMLPDETLADILARYERVAARTDALVESLPDLDLSHPLPPAPWFAPGATRSVRRVFLHIVAETAQHAGHADIIRETIDGQKTMG